VERLLVAKTRGVKQEWEIGRIGDGEAENSNQIKKRTND